MENEENLKDPELSNKNYLALIIISISAVIGALIPIIISRANRIKATFQREQASPRYDMQGETGETSPAGTDMPTPSQGQQGIGAAGVVTANTPDQIITAPVRKNPVAQAQSPKSTSPKPGATAPNQAVVVKRWSTPTRYIMGVFLFLATLVVLYIGRSAIPLVVAAALLALFIDPLIGFLTTRFRLKRGLAVGITYSIVISLFLLIPLLAIPSLVSAVNFVVHIDTQLIFSRLIEMLQSISDSITTTPALAALVQPLLDSLTAMVNNWASAGQVEAPAVSLSVEELTSQFGQVLGSLSKFLGPTFSFLASLFFTLLLSIQMTLTADGMRNWSADLIPPGYGPELDMMVNKIRRTWVGFLRGEMSLMLIIGTVTWLGCTILGLPQALFLGVIAGVMELIPNIGPTLAAVPAVVLALLFGSTNFAISNGVFALIVIGFYVVVQLVENQVIVPRVMGDAVDLPPLVVLIGTIAGAGAFGIMGALLATPVIATGNLVFRYIYRKIIEDQPVEPPIEEKHGFMDNIRSLISRVRLPGALGKRSSPNIPKTISDPEIKKE